MHRPQTLRVWGALWVVYLIWGSTYLAIRVAVHPSHGVGLPPLLMAAARFLLAGVILLALTARRPAADRRPDPLGRRQWWAAAVVGTALLLGGNGLVTLAERQVPSGMTAVIIATVPIWTAVMSAARGREPLTLRHVAGLLLGLAGVSALVVGHGGGRAHAGGVALLIAASVAWAFGSFYAQRAALPRRPLVSTGAQMLSGSVALLVVAVATGEPGQVHLHGVPASAWVAFAYLVVFGAVVSYSAYVWLLKNARLSLVTTYAYVNPVVAVILGALILSEPFTVRTAAAMVATLLGVALIAVRRVPVPARGVTEQPEQEFAA